MNTMDSYPQAGAAFQGERNQAAAGMRSYRNDIYQKLFDLRQRGMKTAVRDNAKDRRMQMLSAGLMTGGALAPLAFPGKKPQTPFFNEPIDNVPLQQMLPSYLPPEMKPDRFRQGYA